MDKFVNGVVEVISLKDGQVLSKSNNAFTLNAEDFVALFLSKSFANKYDYTEGLTQSGYYDFIAIGSGFVTPIEGTVNVFVLPNKLIGIPDEDVDCFNGATVSVLSGLNDGQTALVALDGYNPSNPAFENRPTITISSDMPNIVAAGVQFVISSSDKETALQGEGRPDFKGAKLTTQVRPLVSSKLILGPDTVPVGHPNEIYISTTVPAISVSGGASVRICEAALVNSNVPPIMEGEASGKVLARVALQPVEIGPGGAVLINWRIRFGAERL